MWRIAAKGLGHALADDIRISLDHGIVDGSEVVVNDTSDTPMKNLRLVQRLRLGRVVAHLRRVVLPDRSRLVLKGYAARENTRIFGHQPAS